MPLAQSCFVRSPDIVARRIEGETILVPIRGAAADLEEIYHLNETAAAVWDLADGTRDVAGIRAVLLARYEADEAALANDVDLLLADLHARGCIHET